MKKISREECYQTALVNLWNHIDALQKEVDRLERVGSGMVERIIRVEGRGGNSLEVYYQDGHSQVFDFVDGEWTPRPAPKTRTVGDMVRGLANAKLTPYQIYQLLDLGRAAGIDLTVTEE